jgi:hypothetical protein
MSRDKRGERLMPSNQSRTETLLRLRAQHVPQGVATTHPLFIAQAQGAH